MSIEVKNITKTFGVFTALSDVSIKIETGELVALLGPSGSGKTTLLRIIAGLEMPDECSGPILFYGEDVASQRVGDRGVGFVFQHYALFRHMSVFENIAFGLRVRPKKTRPGKAEIKRRVTELLQLIQLDTIADRYPHQLSGGQRQRVALARALAVEPQVLLLDEPFGALDAKVRTELRSWLRRLHDEIHVTSVFVTHDQDEALEVADRVAVMNAGKIEQFGTPNDVFHHPETEFVMNFLGSVNQFHGRLESGMLQLEDGKYVYEIDSQNVVDMADDQFASVFVRPHELKISLTPIDASRSLKATITRVHAAGAHVRVDLRTETGDSLSAELSHQETREMKLQTDLSVYVTPHRIRVFSTTQNTPLQSGSY